MWYVNSIIEIILTLIFLICLIGFVITFVGIFFLYQKLWLSNIMGWSVGIGIINILFILSYDIDWRRGYRDEEDAKEFE